MGRITIQLDLFDSMVDRFNNLPVYAQDTLRSYINDVFKSSLNDLYYFLKKERKIK